MTMAIKIMTRANTKVEDMAIVWPVARRRGCLWSGLVPAYGQAWYITLTPTAHVGSWGCLWSGLVPARPGYV